ncbi:hypothetical protein CY652_03095 [Burkholderia sp. WAC0059]|uniref:hypothetical protein n=1 Tax=Burkholderia sp. WAC0059 TaxID=2066022 RepID=UPI000C7F3555|nr:hypothetical protein [Burkholderia sp. WAC0059]PLZ03971.1 hypothetical protein CY652_03095 [Burkholderia sp. WAC0059]
MKTSTLMFTVLLSASCFAAPVRTAREYSGGHAVAVPQSQPDVDGAPVAPPAPDVPAGIGPGPQHWQHMSLPRSRGSDLLSMPVPDAHLQT